MKLHLPFLLALPLGVIAMMAQDACSVYLTVAEARGRARLAGVCDGLGDCASVLVSVAGVGSILVNGFTVDSAIVLAAIVCTSIGGTWFWTRRASRMKVELP